MKAKVAAAKNIRKWEQISVEAPETRAYEFFADVKFRAGKTAILQDVPTTLLSLYQTITELLKAQPRRKRPEGETGGSSRDPAVQACTRASLQESSATEDKVRTEIVDI